MLVFLEQNESATAPPRSILVVGRLHPGQAGERLLRQRPKISAGAAWTDQWCKCMSTKSVVWHVCVLSELTHKSLPTSTSHTQLMLLKAFTSVRRQPVGRSTQKHFKKANTCLARNTDHETLDATGTCCTCEMPTRLLLHVSA